MTSFTAIDLSKLSIPDIIVPIDYEALLAEMKARVLAVAPEVAPFLELESEPATKILEVCAYFRALDLASFNDGAKACFLATAMGSDLENMAAYWGVERLQISAANDQVFPPIEAVLESDAALRKRTQISLEGHTTAGTIGSYTFHALSASGLIKDVSVAQTQTPGEVVVTILTWEGNGVPNAATLQLVEDRLEEVRPLTDNLTVQGPTIVPLEVEAELTLLPGPDAEAVLAAAKASLQAYLVDTHRLGRDVHRSAIIGSLFVEGVHDINVVKPAVDANLEAHQAAFSAVAAEVTIGGYDV